MLFHMLKISITYLLSCHILLIYCDLIMYFKAIDIYTTYIYFETIIIDFLSLKLNVYMRFYKFILYNMEYPMLNFVRCIIICIFLYSYSFFKQIFLIAHFLIFYASMNQIYSKI